MSRDVLAPAIARTSDGFRRRTIDHRSSRLARGSRRRARPCRGARRGRTSTRGQIALEAEAGSSEQSDATEDADVAEAKPAASRSRARWLRRRRRPTRDAVGAGTAIVLLCASLAASGYFAWQHRLLVQRQQHAAEFVAAAREEVAAMMSIDPAHAQENIQHTIDDATGLLKSQLEVDIELRGQECASARITTKATVEDVAVESMTDNSAGSSWSSRNPTPSTPTSRNGRPCSGDSASISIGR